MERFGFWLAQQFDHGLTPIGGAIGLGLVVCGIGGALALVGGHVWIGSALLGACLLLLAALALAAFKTDPERQLSRAERADRWRRLPAPFKASIWILAGGPVLGQFADLLAPGAALSFSAPMLSGGVACLVFAKGMQTHRPPIHLRRGEALTAEAEPEQYSKKLRTIVRPLYVSGVLAIGTAVLAFAGCPPH